MLTNEQIEIFQSLVDDWSDKSRFQSGMCNVYAPFIKIVEIAKTNKKDYLPLLFDLLKEDFRWYQAIQLVIEDGPLIGPNDIGNVNKIIDIWTQFGKEKGYIK